MSLGVEELLKEAKLFYGEAVDELEKAINEGSRVKMRDAAEKAWNAVVQAANALALTVEGEVPRSHYERRISLKNIEAKIPSALEKGVYDRYAARSRLLHGEIFYEGVFDPDLLRVEVEKAGDFIKIVENIIKDYTL